MKPWYITIDDGKVEILDQNREQVLIFRGAASDKVRLKYAMDIIKSVNMHDDLIKALNRSYGEILAYINEGHFDRKIEFDAGYIVDLLEKDKRLRERENT